MMKTNNSKSNNDYDKIDEDNDKRSKYQPESIHSHGNGRTITTLLHNYRNSNDCNYSNSDMSIITEPMASNNHINTESITRNEQTEGLSSLFVSSFDNDVSITRTAGSISNYDKICDNQNDTKDATNTVVKKECYIEGNDASTETKRNDSKVSTTRDASRTERIVAVAQELSRSYFFPSILSILVDENNNNTGGLTASQILHAVKPFGLFLQEQSRKVHTTIAQTNIHFISPIQILIHCQGISHITNTSGQVHFFRSSLLHENVSKITNINNTKSVVAYNTCCQQQQHRFLSTVSTTQTTSIKDEENYTEQTTEVIIAVSVECLRRLCNLIHMLPEVPRDFLTKIKRYIFEIEEEQQQQEEMPWSLWLQLSNDNPTNYNINDNIKRYAINVVYSQFVKWNVLTRTVITTKFEQHDFMFPTLQWDRNRMKTILNQYSNSSINYWRDNRKGEIQQQHGSGCSNQDTITENNNDNEQKQDGNDTVTNNKKRKLSTMISAASSIQQEEQNDQKLQKRSSTSDEITQGIDLMAAQECLRLLLQNDKNYWPYSRMEFKKFLGRKENRKTCFGYWLLHGQEKWRYTGKIGDRRKESTSRLLDVLHQHKCVQQSFNSHTSFYQLDWSPDCFDQLLRIHSNSSNYSSLEEWCQWKKTEIYSQKRCSFDDKQDRVLCANNNDNNENEQQGKSPGQSKGKNGKDITVSTEDNIAFVAAQECLRILYKNNHFPSNKIQFNEFLRNEEKTTSCCFGYWIKYGQESYPFKKLSIRRREASARLLEVLRRYQCIGLRNDDFDWKHVNVRQVLHIQYKSKPSAANQFQSLQEWYEHIQGTHGNR